MEKQKYNHFKCKDFLLDDDFRAWLAGTAPEKNHLWEKWLTSNPSVRTEVEKAKKLFYALKFKEDNTETNDVDLQWSKLESVILNKVSDQDFEINKPVKRIFTFFNLVAAASVIAILSFSTYYFLLPAKQKVSIETVQKKTGNGQQLKIVLPDGTLVTLNAGSALSYPQQFEDTLREISLTGEAFFKVVPNSKSPFIIHTGDVTTRVLGTSFNVRAYPETKEVQVAVVEGKVKVKATTIQGNEENSVFVTRSEMATFQKHEQELIVSAYDEKEQIGWKDGILYFEKSDFTSTVKKLERWYGVKIQISDMKRMDSTWRFNGKFQNRPLDYILGVMSYPNLFSYKIKKDTVTIL